MMEEETDVKIQFTAKYPINTTVSYNITNFGTTSERGKVIGYLVRGNYHLMEVRWENGQIEYLQDFEIEEAEL